MCIYESFCLTQFVRKIEIHFPKILKPFRMVGTLTMADTLVPAAEHSSGGPSRARPSRPSTAQPEIAKSIRKGLLMLQFLCPFSLFLSSILFVSFSLSFLVFFRISLFFSFVFLILSERFLFFHCFSLLFIFFSLCLPCISVFLYFSISLYLLSLALFLFSP